MIRLKKNGKVRKHKLHQITIVLLLLGTFTALSLFLDVKMPKINNKEFVTLCVNFGT